VSRRIRFVVPSKDDPNTKRIELSEGDHIVIKKRLSIGEVKQIENASLRTLYGQRGPNGLPKTEVDEEGYAMVRLFTWLVEWSFADPSNPENTLPITLQAIAALDPDDYDEIERAINRHLMDDAAAKKSKASATTASPTPSASS
jgi:hypothetical protein